jgi:DNA-binding response OmpR family regulator
MTIADSEAAPKLRCFVVEFDGLTLLLIKDALQEAGHQVIGATTAIEGAIEAIERSRPDLVLMPIRLPGARDGVDLAREIKDRFGIRTIFITAAFDPDTRERSCAVDPLGYVPRPFTVDELSTVVRAAGRLLKG